MPGNIASPDFRQSKGSEHIDTSSSSSSSKEQASNSEDRSPQILQTVDHSFLSDAQPPGVGIPAPLQSVEYSFLSDATETEDTVLAVSEMDISDSRSATTPQPDLGRLTVDTPSSPAFAKGEAAKSPEDPQTEDVEQDLDNLFFQQEDGTYLACKVTPTFGKELLGALCGPHSEPRRINSLPAPSLSIAVPYVKTSSAPMPTLDDQLNEVFSSTERKPYDRHWIANHGIDTKVLEGWNSKHKLDLLVRHGAVVPGDKMRIYYIYPGGSVKKEGEVRITYIPIVSQFANQILLGLQDPAKLHCE